LIKILFETMHDFLDTSILDQNVMDILLMLGPACFSIDIEFVFGATGGYGRFAFFALSQIAVFDTVIS